MTLYPETKVIRYGDWYRVYVLTKKGWDWFVAARSNKEAKKIAAMQRAKP